MIRTGLEVFLEKEYRKYQGMRLGVLCHQASVSRKLVHVSRLIHAKKLKLNVTCYFGPQHGIRGEKQDNMVESEDFTHPKLGIPVYSLYGVTREPTPEMFTQIDTLLIDLQDIGTRIYTFIYTMANCMRVARALGKRIVVLDRPNPIGGVQLEGNVLSPDLTSFVGQYPICTRHAMTIGELALLFNEAFGIGCELDIIRVQGWRRAQYSESWGRDWVSPSPNIPNAAAALVFPGMVHFEGTNVSEGRGTCRPFEAIGAPFVDADQLCDQMNRLRLPGVYFRPIYFQPTYQKAKEQVCAGAHIHVTDRKKFNAFKVGIHLLKTIAALYPKSFEWKKPPYEYEHTRMPIDLIAGTSTLRKLIESSGDLKPLEREAESQLRDFKKLRRNFLLYRV